MTKHGFSMTRRWWAVGAVALLAACGGGGDSTTATRNPTAVAGVSTLGTPANTTVSVTKADGSKGDAWRVLAFDFDGKVEQGPSTGTEFKGRLLLEGRQADGSTSTTLKGVLLTGVADGSEAPLTDAQREQLRAVQERTRTQAETLSSALRTQAQSLSQTLGSALRAATTDEQRRAAVDAFNAAFQAAVKVFQDGMTALQATRQAEVRAIVGARPEPQAIAVTGALEADGKIALTFALSASATLQGTGTVAADGTAGGSFTGPAAGDQGTWRATAVARDWPEMPTPPGANPPAPPSPPEGACTGSGSNANALSIASTVVEFTSLANFKMSVPTFLAPSGAAIIDGSAATFTRGTAADVKVGANLQICANEGNAQTIRDGGVVKAKTIAVR
jgi:hypothetical protein